ncbi:DUF2637 domain-containing protein [Streptomyces sp. NPDC005263]|uniref:DUF2637 domain-containing protein n=1 Tax=Streptomyces sp. NPDC005263 TaxID=3364711 RepID=UPI0036A5FA56
MTIAATPPTAAPAPTVPTTRPAVPAAHDRVPAAPAAVPETPPAASAAPRRDRSETTIRGVTILALVGGAILAGIGFAGSYKALQGLGQAKGFGDFAYVFPIGLDAGIIVLLALDLLLIRRRTPWPVLRLLAHTFTVGTVVFNAASGGKPIGEDLVGAGMHAVIPLMFIASVEAGRRLVIRITALEDGRQTDGVPLHRWLLAPGPTFALWRRMKLWDVPTYAEAVAREQALKVYRVMLERRYGSVRKAPSDVRLPLTMAPYGLTIAEALELPRVEAEREKALEDAQKAAEATAAEREADRAAQAQIAALKRQGAVQAAQVEVAAATGQVETRARAELVAAERAATAETEAIESATIAEAKAREAAAELAAAEARKRAAGIDHDAAETERAAAETRARAAEAEAREEAARTATVRAREARAEAEARAAGMELDAAETRRRAAEIERAAVEAEDVARLSPKERMHRKVARMILTAGGTADALPIHDVAEAFGVSVSTASEYRTAAAALLADGYRPEGM